MEKRIINYSFLGNKLADCFNIKPSSAIRYCLYVLNNSPQKKHIPAGFKEAMIQEIEKQTNQEISKLQKL